MSEVEAAEPNLRQFPITSRVPQAHHADVDSAAMHALRNVEDVTPSVRVGLP